MTRVYLGYIRNGFWHGTRLRGVFRLDGTPGEQDRDYRIERTGNTEEIVLSAGIVVRDTSGHGELWYPMPAPVSTVATLVNGDTTTDVELGDSDNWRRRCPTGWPLSPEVWRTLVSSTPGNQSPVPLPSPASAIRSIAWGDTEHVRASVDDDGTLVLTIHDQHSARKRRIEARHASAVLLLLLRERFASEAQLVDWLTANGILVHENGGA